MGFKIYIVILILSIIICTPPPIPQPPYVISREPPAKEENKDGSSNFKNLEENPTSQYVEYSKAIINILENGVEEQHEVNITTKAESFVFTSYSFTISLPKGKTLNVKSNTCEKFPLSDNTENNICSPSFDQIESQNSYKFTYQYKLFKDEKIIIKYDLLITLQNEEKLYRQESISVGGIYSGGKCDYKFIIPDNYINLGLKNNFFKKESEKIFFYNDDCPSEQINDEIRMTPKESYWKADMRYEFETESSVPISGNISFTLPRMYKGGKNRNKNYKITMDDTELNESDLIKDEVFLKTEIPGKNKQKVGINIHTAFGNKLNDDFIVYASQNFYKLDENIDDVIKNKAKEIINDQNSEYKDYPNYYKIGKFVHSHITYNLDYHGRNLTALEIYNAKQGVCEHYTILYNAMLNAIGIKTIKTFGWALDKNQTSATEATIGHAWTAALINGKFIELDATWNLFEGVPAGHILKGYNQESYSYSYTTKINFLKTHNIELVDNLDNEEKDSTEDVPLPPKENEVTLNQEESNSRNIKISVYLYILSLLILLL